MGVNIKSGKTSFKSEVPKFCISHLNSGIQIEGDSGCLSLNQLSMLFGRDNSVLSMHLKKYILR